MINDQGVVRRWLWPIVVTLLVAAGVWLAVFRAEGYDLQRLGDVGSALSPLVGLLSVFALLAAIDSVRTQQVAVGLQRDAVTEQGKATAEQAKAVGLQRVAITEQRAALEREIGAQRHAAMGAAYARLYGVLELYRAELLRYCARYEAQDIPPQQHHSHLKTAADLYANVRIAKWEVAFVDGNKERELMRAALTKRHQLDDVSTPYEQRRAHAFALKEAVTLQLSAGHKLRRHVMAEMGLYFEAADNDEEET